MFDEHTLEFLNALKPSTRSIYAPALGAFQKFYASQGTIQDFLDRVDKDMQLPRMKKQRVARNTLKDFVVWMQTNTDFKPKTIRTYVTAVQSLGRYFDLAITTRYIDLPSSNPVSKKYPWTLESIVKFVDLMDKPVYKSIAVSMFQSGLDVSTLLSINYGDIKEEFEAGVVPLCLDLARVKTDTPFMSFIGTWGVSVLKEYLADRQLQSVDPIYTLSKSAIEKYFARQAKKFIGPYTGQNPCRPHSLRAAFYTACKDNKVDPDYIEFWMAHEVPEQRKVYMSKSRDGWRKAYAEQAEPALTPIR